MNREEFLNNIADALQTEESLSFDTVLDGLDEWDSLSKMAVLAFLNKNFDAKLTFSDFKSISTIEDLAKKAGV